MSKITNEDHTYHVLEEQLLDSIKNSKETKTKILNRPTQDWINKSIIQDIQTRNLLWTEHKQYPQDKTKEEIFKKKRNEIAENIQNTKKKYYQKSFDECKKKPNKMWNLLNNLSTNKIKKTSAPSTLQTPSGLTNDIGVTLASQISKQTYDFKIKSNDREGTTGTTLNANIISKLSPTNTEEIANIIDNLNNNTSCGVDGISTKTIKSVKNLIINELTLCVNMCLE